MPIATACPHCARKINAPDSAAGKRVKCPKCQQAFAVPPPNNPAPSLRPREVFYGAGIEVPSRSNPGACGRTGRRGA